MCLYFKKVEFDIDAENCLFPSDADWYYDYLEPLWLSPDRPFIDINECLEKYEKTNADSTEMKLKKVNSLTLYTKANVVNLNNLVVDEDEDAEPVVVADLPTNLTAKQIEEFLCNETMSLTFHTSPYSLKNDKNKYIK